MMSLARQVPGNRHRDRTEFERNIAHDKPMNTIIHTSHSHTNTYAHTHEHTLMHTLVDVICSYLLITQNITKWSCHLVTLLADTVS